MTEAEWLKSENPVAMIRGLGGQLSARKRLTIRKTLRDQLTLRKLRLFGCACCRRIWDSLDSPAAKNAVEVAEQFADREATSEALAIAHQAASADTTKYNPIDWPEEDEIRGANEHPRFMAHVAAMNSSGNKQSLSYAADCASTAAHDKRVEQVSQSRLLRDIFGNPFRPVTFSPEWRTDTAVSLARGMYEARDFGAMPILADALQDAGCDNEDVLNHCRDATQVHARGCWVIDLVLGKE